MSSSSDFTNAQKIAEAPANLQALFMTFMQQNPAAVAAATGGSNGPAHAPDTGSHRHSAGHSAGPTDPRLQINSGPPPGLPQEARPIGPPTHPTARAVSNTAGEQGGAIWVNNGPAAATAVNEGGAWVNPGSTQLAPAAILPPPVLASRYNRDQAFETNPPEWAHTGYRSHSASGSIAGGTGSYGASGTSFSNVFAEARGRRPGAKHSSSGSKKIGPPGGRLGHVLDPPGGRHPSGGRAQGSKQATDPKAIVHRGASTAFALSKLKTVSHTHTIWGAHSSCPTNRQKLHLTLDICHSFPMVP